MHLQPVTKAVIYLIVGLFLIGVATQTTHTLWNATTIILALFSTLAIGTGIRILIAHIRSKRNR
ncbi:MAG TPA: DUF4305 domain-containing protein [Bacillota bacterium]|nr:DUF4305 domain-containing protein [Bacillota bacterium]